MKVKVIALTKIVDEDLLKTLKKDSSEELIMYAARVSSPNQVSSNPKLLNYCVKKAHWSVFEQASMTIEIHTSRAISAQILRHKSFFFQEFSQRYAKTQSWELYPARSQDLNNRQASKDDMEESDKKWFIETQKKTNSILKEAYEEALQRGIAKEQARFLLPMSASTKLYMTGSIRSWIHYINIRCGEETQKEHRDIADAIKVLFIEQFPIISESLEWT